ncbi:hypothetical protein SDC9_77952 [bioreactor metagenome]|uniref:Calcineurin-like phosphoesterase domain-containing protein n=1 Tax=bioreactor metagenome TaxID=1076179 RepID=A0A644YSV7_9ZZZZ
MRGDKQFKEELFNGDLDGFDDVVESIFGCEIAWEYFENESALNALIQEVFKGEEFFKYRHLDEVEVCRKYTEAFQNAPSTPTLILGHSHEPRLNALNEHNRPERHYANCGTEGRFENLIWCIEVEGDDMRVVSWHYERLLDGVPDPNAMHRPPVRTVYQSNGDVLVQNRVEELPA